MKYLMLVLVLFLSISCKLQKPKAIIFQSKTCACCDTNRCKLREKFVVVWQNTSLNHTIINYEQYDSIKWLAKDTGVWNFPQIKKTCCKPSY
jgi:hypothetical protein